MRIYKKENNGFGINCNFDKKSYDAFRKDVMKLVKKYEDDSKIHNLKYSVFISGIRTPYMKVKGWSSRVIDPKTKQIQEVLFLDYDNTLRFIVEQELQFLRKKYNLPPFYLFSTKEEIRKEQGQKYGNYIAINLKVLNFGEVVKIHLDTHSDTAHQEVGKNNIWKTWVLRISSKGKKRPPKFEGIIGDINKKYPQKASQGHLEALKQLYPDIPTINYSNLNGGKVSDLFLDEYLTASI